METFLSSLTVSWLISIATVQIGVAHKTTALHVSSFVTTRHPVQNREGRRSFVLKDQEYADQEEEEEEEGFQDDKKEYDATAKQTMGEEDFDTDSLSNTDLGETQRLIQAQQKQIDMLMQLVQSTDSTIDPDSSQQQATRDTSSKISSVAPTTVYTSSLAPLKAMLFIDGTWLYYSIHERQSGRDIIGQKFGKGWQYRYFVDWKRLPRLICEALQEQDQGWSSLSPGSNGNSASQGGTRRPIEIVRVPVFTSYKAETPKTSFRYQMYEEMKEANYDVHMMETVGRNEKCVDIQLAVDMLHFATVPNAYDVALLLSGDKDFLPALVRTRQKGRSVGLVSMQTACNRALLESPHVKDYNPVWLEDLLDELIQPRSSTGLQQLTISSFTLMKIISDFVSKSGFTRVSSRDIGRYLKSLTIGRTSLLIEMKQIYGGLYQFVTVAGAYDVEVVYDDSTSRSFWVGLREDSKLTLLQEAKRTQLSNDEKLFFESYSLDQLDDKENSYWYTTQLNGGAQLSDEMTPSTVRFFPKESLLNGSEGTNQVNISEKLTRDYSKCTLVELKEYCRERGLPVSGRKSEVLERLEKDIKEEIARLEVEGKESTDSSTSTPEEYLHALVDEYVHVSGGKAGSRDVGRYLAANKSSDGTTGQSALQELKQIYGGLKNFVYQFESFYIEEKWDDSSYEFMICRDEALSAA